MSLSLRADDQVRHRFTMTIGSIVVTKEALTPVSFNGLARCCMYRNISFLSRSQTARFETEQCAYQLAKFGFEFGLCNLDDTQVCESHIKETKPSSSFGHTGMDKNAGEKCPFHVPVLLCRETK